MKARRKGMTVVIRATFIVALLSIYLVGAETSPPATASPAQVVQLCVSAPRGTPQLSLLARGIVDAVTLATLDWHRNLLAAKVDAVMPLQMDDSPLDLHGRQERANAMRCVREQHTVAYVGPLNSGVAAASEPVLNRSGMAQISPSTTQPLLTSPQTREALEPNTFARTLKYVTFYRLVADDRAQGAMMAAYFSRQHHAHTFFSLDDSSIYGTVLLNAAYICTHTLNLRMVGKAHLSTGSLQSLSTGTTAAANLIAALQPDGVLYGGDSEALVNLVAQLREHHYHGTIVGGDALFADKELPARIASSGSVQVVAVNIGPDPGAVSKQFNRRFLQRFGYKPQMYTALAYDAAATAYHAILTAQRAGLLGGSIRAQRPALLPFIRFANRTGVTGRIRFDDNGDTLTPTISLYVAHASRWSYRGIALPCTSVPSTR